MADHPEDNDGSPGVPFKKDVPSSLADKSRAVDVNQYPEELAQLDVVRTGADLARSGVRLMGPSPVGSALVTGAQLAATKYIQEQHLTLSAGEYEKGVNDALRRDIAGRVPSLPEVPTPTRVGRFVCENTPTEFNIFSRESHVAHGYAAASTANIAYNAMAGSEGSAFSLVNRFIMADAIGRHNTRPENEPHAYMFDFAQPKLRKLFKDHTVNVISISQIGHDDPLADRADHDALIQKLDQQYGANIVYVIANSNHALGATVRHNAIHAHPVQSLNIGAVEQERVRVGTASFDVAKIASYSVPDPDIAVPVPSKKEGYTTLKNGEVEPYTLSGTSFAAPHAAAGVARLMERFVKSDENPDARLSPDTVLLAVKQTARPLIVREGSLSARLVPQTYVNGRQVSAAAGNGQADFRAAWELLEKMETRVRNTEISDRDHAPMPYDLEKAYVRDRVFVSPVTLNKPTPERDEQWVTDGFDVYKGYKYTLPVESPHYADTILVHMHSQPLNQSVRMTNGQVFIESPEGHRLQLQPSASGRVEEQHPDGTKTYKDGDYLIAKVPGMQGMPIAGNWSVIASSPIDSITLSFPNAMQKDDVGMVVKPARRPARELYHHADLRNVKAEDLDDFFVQGGAFIPADYDFSQTAFPSHYMQTRLVALVDHAHNAKDSGNTRLAEDYTERARQLLSSNYPGFERKDELYAAVEQADAQKTLALLTPQEGPFEWLAYAARREEPRLLETLLINGLDPKATNGREQNVLFFTKKDSETGQLLATVAPELLTMRDCSGLTEEEFHFRKDNQLAIGDSITPILGFGFSPTPPEAPRDLPPTTQPSRQRQR